MITLSDGTETIELPEDLNWSDRHWSPVAQAFTRSVTGKPIIQEAASQQGRPITLEPPTGGGWMLASNEPQITDWHDTPGQKLTLDYHGETHTVQFRHHDGQGYESTPVRYVIKPAQDPGHQVIPIFRFITVEP